MLGYRGIQIMDIVWTGSPCCTFRRDYNRLSPKDRQKRRLCFRMDVGYHIAQTEVSTETFVGVGHARWDIENKGIQ